MVAPVIGAAAVGGGLQLVGDLVGGRQAYSRSSKLLDRQQDFQYGVWKEQQQREDTAVRRRVADAQAAGIHPLFALGYPGTGGPMPAGGSAQVTGSNLGTGLAAMGRTAAQLSIEMQRAQIRKTNAEAMAIDSATKRGEQDVVTGPRTYGVDVWGAAPRARRIGKALATRPIESVGRMSIPQRVEYIRPDGSLGWAYHPELGADEIGQVVIAGQDVGHWVRSKRVPAAKRRRWYRVQRRKALDPELVRRRLF